MIRTTSPCAPPAPRLSGSCRARWAAAVPGSSPVPKSLCGKAGIQEFLETEYIALGRTSRGHAIMPDMTEAADLVFSRPAGR
jgi:hypothetical protein